MLLVRNMSVMVLVPFARLNGLWEKKEIMDVKSHVAFVRGTNKQNNCYIVSYILYPLITICAIMK